MLFAVRGHLRGLAAFVIFCIAGASDALDGLAARKLNAGSDFGRMLDPIADKILVAVALMMLVSEGNFQQLTLDFSHGLRSLLKLVPALVILSREILVSGLREFLAGAAVSVPVTACCQDEDGHPDDRHRRHDPRSAGLALAAGRRRHNI